MYYAACQEIRMQDLIPADELLAMPRKDRVQPRVEPSVQASVILEAVLADEGLDSRIGIPLHPVVLVASDVDTFIGEQLGHFAKKPVQQLVYLLVGRIQ